MVVHSDVSPLPFDRHTPLAYRRDTYMRMILTQCSGSGIFIAHWHPRTLFALVMVPCDAPFTHVVDHVPLALDVRVFGRGTSQIAQILVSCDAHHALVVDHVALALDERGFGHGAAKSPRFLYPVMHSLFLSLTM